MGKYFKEFSKGILKENPVFRLCLGTCPTLAISTTLSGSIGMGLAATLVLICSNTVISLLRKVIPDKIRIPAYITVIAGFVTIVQMLVQAFLPALNATLGIYLPLIVVNCIILGRAEAFAGKNPVLLSALDGLGMGIGFTVSISLMGFIRELLGSGTVLGHTVGNPPMLIFVMAPGGFFVFGMMVALVSAISKKHGKKPVEQIGCENCPAKGCCGAAEVGCDGEGAGMSEGKKEAEKAETAKSVEKTAAKETDKSDDNTAQTADKATDKTVDKAADKTDEKSDDNAASADGNQIAADAQADQKTSKENSESPTDGQKGGNEQ